MMFLNPRRGGVPVPRHRSNPNPKDFGVAALASILICTNALGNELPDDPFADDLAVETSPYQNELSLMGYYQSNKVNDNHSFNPDLTRFADDDELGVIDWQFKADWQSNWQARARTALIWQDDDANGKLLEGYIGWHSDDLALRARLGRVKTEWSNGYNWSLTNLMRPYRDRPYIDLDDPLQQQGWDMLDLSYGNANWRGTVIIGDQQYATRLTYQGTSDHSLILYKQDGQKLNIASSFSTLISDAMTFRMEWNLQKQREQTLAGTVEDSYHKLMFGGAYTNEAGFNFRLEYLHNGHGYNSSQWRNIEHNSELAYQNIQTGLATTSDYHYLANALGTLRNGQLRRNYLYFMLMTSVSENLWQYRQSVQYNVDDNSQLHRLELLKSFNDHFSARLQWEAFNGCDTCEYGLNPNKNNLRLVLKHVF